MRISATKRMHGVLAEQAMAVPKSGCKTISHRKTSTGAAAGSNVLRQSSMLLVRPSRKYARNKISTGLANSEGCSEKPFQRIQRWVLCERSRKKTEIRSNVVNPIREKTTAGLL